MGLPRPTVNKHLVIFFGKMDVEDALPVIGRLTVNGTARISHAGRREQSRVMAADV